MGKGRKLLEEGGGRKGYVDSVEGREREQQQQEHNIWAGASSFLVVYERIPSQRLFNINVAAFEESPSLSKVCDSLLMTGTLMDTSPIHSKLRHQPTGQLFCSDLPCFKERGRQMGGKENGV